jgi:tetratricopeptide (TPR) repeat protein
MRLHEPTTSVEDELAALKDAFATCGRASYTPVAGLLMLDRHGHSVDALLASFERHVITSGGTFITGTWREGFIRPFGGLLDVVDALAEKVFTSQPELLHRYSLTVVNLLPAWRKAETLRKVGELRSGLADFVLHGDRAGLKDFYWKRNVAPLVAADLVHFTVDAAVALAESTGAPTVLCFRDAHLADHHTAEVLQLLSGYSWQRPVLLCATAREWTETLESRLAAAPDERHAWHVTPLAGDADAEDFVPTHEGWLTPRLRQVVQSASVLVLPFDASALKALLPEALGASAEQSLAALLDEGVLHRFGAARFSFSSPNLRDAVYRSLEVEPLKRLHAAALEVEKTDSYAALWHASKAELPEEIKHQSIKATESAWAVSDYGSAIVLAKQYLGAANGDGAFSGDLLMALLHYDAGQHQETDRYLTEALKQPRSDTLQYIVFERLLGYNAIFGLGDFERGREIMESVLQGFEARGLQQDAGYVRNTIAYSLFCMRRFDDAVEMERTALKLLESSDRPGGFLFSVLQLNLGRVYRSLGFHDQALSLFKTGLDAPNLEQSPYMLLIFHTTLAQFYVTRGEYAEAVAAFHHCLDLARDLELENASDPVLNSLSRPVGKLLSDRTTRGDEVFFYLYLNLALAYRQIGLNSRSEGYLAGMKKCWGFLGHDVWRAAEAVVAGGAPLAVTSRRDAAKEFAEEVGEAECRFEGLMFEEAGAEHLARRVADILAEGKVVALAGPRAVGPNVHSFGSLVLYDPREPQLAERVNAEVGAYGSKRARTALLLPEAVGLFGIGIEPLPLVLQEATLKPQYREEMAALVPYRSRVQVLSHEFDGLLFEILTEFAQRTGIGVLAAVPFHTRGRDLAVSAVKASSAFLISSIDHLVLGERLLTKTWGPAADENILPFRPRLSRNASIFRKAGVEETDKFLLLVRTWSFHNYLRLHREMRPILDLCDGQRSVAEIVHQMEAGLPPDSQLEQRVCAFLRKLGRQSAIVFDDPLVRTAEAVKSHA